MLVTAVSPSGEVRTAIAEAGLSIIEAARRLGVSRQQLTRLLGRKSALSPEMALRLQSVFGLSARDLLQSQLLIELEAARRATRRELQELDPYRGSPSRPKREVVLRRLRAHEPELRKTGIGRLHLFGSVAREEARAGSDVDLCFEPAPGARIGFLELQKIRRRIDEILGLTSDLVPEDAFRPHVKAAVDRDAIRVF